MAGQGRVNAAADVERVQAKMPVGRSLWLRSIVGWVLVWSVAACWRTAAAYWSTWPQEAEAAMEVQVALAPTNCVRMHL